MSSFDPFNDLVGEVLHMLKSSRLPPATILHKAIEYHRKLMCEIKNYKGELNDKGKVEESTVTSVGKDTVKNRNSDKAVQVDLGGNELYKVMEANAKNSVENAKFKQDLIFAKSEIETLKSQINELTQENDRLRLEESIKKKQNDLNETNGRLESKIANLSEELELAQKQTTKKSRQFKLLEENLRKLIDSNKRLKSENANLEKTLESAKYRGESQSSQPEELSYKEATYRNDEILSTNMRLESELKATNDKIQRLIEERNNQRQHEALSREDVYAVKQDNERLLNKNIWLEKELQAVKDKLQIVTEERNREKQNAAKTREKVHAVSHDNERLRSRNRGLERDLKATNDKMQILLEERNTEKQKDISRRQDADFPRMFEKQKEQITQLSEDNKKLQDLVHDLRNRLSVLAGHKLTADNPNIADLGDAYRPINIAEELRQVYDNEWTYAYEELDKKNPDKETKLINTLLTILKNIETVCVEVSSKQFESLSKMIVNEITYPKYHHKSGTVIAGKHRAEMSSSQAELTDKLIKDLRKSLGILSTGPLAQIFHQVYVADNKAEDMFAAGVNAYVIESVKLVWMMKMQTPPMEFLWAEPKQPVDKNKFTFYTKRGNVVKLCVWPAVVLHKDGPLMSKGIVQAT